jgi:hypothetical protein
MPVDHEGRVRRRNRRFGAPRWIVVATLAIVAAAPLWLGACDQLQLKSFDTGQPAVAKPAGESPTPVTAEKLAPVPLAPTMTGAKPAAASAAPMPPPKPATVAAKPPPPPAAAAVAPRPAAPAAPAVVAAQAAPPPNVTCPAGTVGMWSHDVTDTSIYICRHLHP